MNRHLERERGHTADTLRSPSYIGYVASFLDLVGGIRKADDYFRPYHAHSSLARPRSLATTSDSGRSDESYQNIRPCDVRRLGAGSPGAVPATCAPPHRAQSVVVGHGEAILC